ncbi:MAG: hypothetical protein B7Z35_04880 [Hydrogenophilales bacterium 12-61-10]|nr:MAG: hypothetical protein B7Z35_04880 [Hydrogenophilales bacterium 12-61-10]
MAKWTSYVSLAFLWPGLTHADYLVDVFFHMQGEPGNRQAFFANTLVDDRTPLSMLMGPIEIKQLDVTVIYENAQQPEWAEMRLQFECASKVDFGKGIPKQPAWTDPVKMRLGEGGTILRRSDLKIESTPAGAWQMASSPVLLKAHKLACNRDEVNAAVNAAVRASGKTLDSTAFNTELRKIGLTEDMTLINGSAPQYLELAWSVLWAGSKRPDPSGKWAKKATPEEKAAAMAKIAEAKTQLAELTKKTKQAYEPKIQAAEIKFDFDKVAAKLRNGRKLNRTESQMLMVWQGKLEEEVASIVGRPSLTTTGNVRFLSYGKDYDTRAVYDYKGGTYVTHGIYWSCDVQFVTTPDRQGAFRVADVRISVDSNMGMSAKGACEGLLHVPGN